MVLASTVAVFVYVCKNPMPIVFFHAAFVPHVKTGAGATHRRARQHPTSSKFRGRISNTTSGPRNRMAAPMAASARAAAASGSGDSSARASRAGDESAFSAASAAPAQRSPRRASRPCARGAPRLPNLSSSAVATAQHTTQRWFERLVEHGAGEGQAGEEL